MRASGTAASTSAAHAAHSAHASSPPSSAITCRATLTWARGRQFLNLANKTESMRSTTQKPVQQASDAPSLALCAVRGKSCTDPFRMQHMQIRPHLRLHRGPQHLCSKHQAQCKCTNTCKMVLRYAEANLEHDGDGRARV